MTAVEFNLDNVTQEIENWILNYLDRPSDHYNGNKPCPFAAKAWFDNKCHVIIGDGNMIDNILHTWDDQFEIVIVAVPELQSGGLEEFCEQVNSELIEFNSDLVLMPFVAGEDDPDDPNLDPDHWGKLLDEAYSMVFIQRLSEVNRLSKVLEKKGYYDKVSPEFWAYVKARRSL